MVAATCSGVSTALVATSMTPTMTVLCLSSPISDSGTRELAHSSETCWMLLAIDRREDLLVLAPLAAEGLLPVEVGLDAVAVADVDRRLALEARRCPLERGDAPVVDLVHEDVERGLVELDEIDALRFELARLGIERVGEGHRHVGRRP